MKNKLFEIVRAMSFVAFTNEKKAEYLSEHDVVQVVPCGKCKHYNPEGDVWGECILLSKSVGCREYNIKMQSDSYCSHGERKIDETTI